MDQHQQTTNRQRVVFNAAAIYLGTSLNQSLIKGSDIVQAHILGKSDSPCCANCALKSTALDNRSEYSARIIETILDHFYMDDYLDSSHSLEQAISVMVDVIQLLKPIGFNLNKFVSRNQEILKYTI